MPFCGSTMPSQLFDLEGRLDLRFEEHSPLSVVIKHAQIGKSGRLNLVAGDRLARHLLLNDPQRSLRWNLLDANPAKKGSYQRAIMFERACQRVRQSILGLGVLVED